MKLSIRQIFFNLKAALVLLGLIVTVLGLQIINTAQLSERLSALQKQHILVKKIIATDLHDPAMARISVNTDIAELSLFVKLSNKKALLDTFISPTNEQSSLERTLASSSLSFQDAAVFWVESMSASKSSMHERMLSARTLYLVDIADAMDYQIQLIAKSVGMAKITIFIVFLFGFIVFFLYQWRLRQIYSDLQKGCVVDSSESKEVFFTEEITYIMERFLHKSQGAHNNPTLFNGQSGIYNKKGLLTSYNAKRSTKSLGSIFLVSFMIDKHQELIEKFSPDEMGEIYKKIGDILSMYEQPLDIAGHFDDNTFGIVMSRNSKESAVEYTQKVIASVGDAIFATTKGSIKITLSGGLLLKIPSKSIEEGFSDAAIIAKKAIDSGGNKLAQQREGADMYR